MTSGCQRTYSGVTGPQSAMMILDLPIELLSLILAHLPLSTLLSLHYTSRLFSALIPLTTHHLYALLPPPPYSYPTPIAHEWLLYLSLLERSSSKQLKLVCRPCLRPHHRTLFSPAQQDQPALQRSCLGTEHKMWICPHKSWSMKEVLKLRDGQLRVWHPSLWPVEPCRCLKDGVGLHTLFFHVRGMKGRMKSIFGRGVHVRLRDPKHWCLTHAECWSVGCKGTEYQCRLCEGAFFGWT